MIGIIGAMKIEVEGIRALTENAKTEIISGMEFVSGTVKGRPVVSVVCGIGKVAAGMCAEAMILRYAPDVILNTGVAGTLTDALSVGDIALSADVVQHDMDTVGLGDEPGYIHSLGVVRMAADGGLVKKLEQGVAALPGVKCVVGTIASGDQFICDKAVKDSIVARFNGIACEMEGAAIGQVCCTNKVPFAVVRAISDSADGSAEMSYTEFLPIAAENAKKLIEYIIEAY